VRGETCTSQSYMPGTILRFDSDSLLFIDALSNCHTVVELRTEQIILTAHGAIPCCRPIQAGGFSTPLSYVS